MSEDKIAREFKIEDEGATARPSAICAIPNG
jgi:hypothetical protein